MFGVFPPDMAQAFKRNPLRLNDSWRTESMVETFGEPEAPALKMEFFLGFFLSCPKQNGNGKSVSKTVNFCVAWW